MMTRVSWRRGLALAVLALAARTGAAEPSAPRRVLALAESNPELTPVYSVFLAEFRAGLPLGESIELRTETFDTARLGDEGYRAAFRSWLASQYAGSAPDVIVAVGEVPLGFLARPASTPWPDVPVVFGALDDRSQAVQHLPPGFTGVTEHLAMPETLDLALRLFPATRHIALFGGASPRERRLAELLRQEADRRADRLDVIDLRDLSPAALVDRVGALPDGCVVVGTSYARDPEGRHWDVRRILRNVAETRRAPVFTLHRQALGTGVVGGVVADYADTGRRVAGLVLRVLDGERPAQIPVQRAGPYRTVLDGRELDRWKVPAARVPAEAEILFREPGSWRRYRWLLVAGFTALALEAVLIAGLLLERRNRLAAERRARESLLAVAHMNRVGAIGELAGAFAHELNTPLGAALNNAQAARRFLAMERADDVRACLDDIVGDVRRAGEVVQRMRGVLRREELRPSTVQVSDVVQRAVRLVEAEARDRDVALEVEVAPGLASLDGDEVQLVQVVVNVLLNAIEALAALPRDQRRVSIRGTAARGGVELRMVDTGPGIPPAQLERVFEPFYTTKSGGLGLGLAISRSIVEAHGGRMWADAAPEAGTTFHVVLPSRKASGAAG